MYQRKVLITGGGGFLGIAVARKCLERGDRVYSFSRNHHPELSALGVSQILGDVADAHLVDDALKGMDVVFHLASKTGSWGRLSTYYKTNVKGTRNIISSCKKWAVPVLVYTSTTRVMLGNSDVKDSREAAAYPERFRSNYAMSKAFAEQAVIKAADNHLRTIVLRPHMIWGPGDSSSIPGLMKKGGIFFKIGDGKNKVSGIYVEDAAKAHLAAAEKVAENPGISGKAYVIAQNDPLVLWDFIDRIQAMKGRHSVRCGLPAGFAFSVGKTLEFIHKNLQIPFEPVLSRNLIKELSLTHVFDVSPAVKDLDFEPSVSVAEGMKHYEAWLNAVRHNR
jgi:nucleoside-diphosphate-sugar epimerase